MTETAITLHEGEQRAPAPITPMEMLQIAVEKGADLDQLQKLMDLHERWEAGQARKNYVRALTAFKADPPTVRKTKRAGFQSRRTGERTDYEYATLDQVTAVIAPALSEHGLSHRWTVEQSEAGIAVTCILIHEDGHSEQVTMRAAADDSGSKNTIQAIASTVTYLERYTLLAITGLAASGMDVDGALIETISDEQAKEIKALLKKLPPDATRRFLNAVPADSVDQIPRVRFDAAKSSLTKKIAEASA